MNADPDKIIIVEGKTITQDVTDWHVHDNAEKMSHIDVTIKNDDFQYSGVFDWEQKLQLRYGYGGGDWSELATVGVATVEEIYDTEGPCLVKITGHDDTRKLCGGNKRGAIKKKSGGNNSGGQQTA